MARRAALWTLAAVFAVAVVWLAWIALHVAWWRTHPPRETAFMTQRLEALKAVNPRATLRYRWVPYPRISDHLKRAMIAGLVSTGCG